MPELPTPPEEYSKAEEAAFRQGQAAMADLLGGHALTLAGHLRDDASDAPDGMDDDGPPACEACGGEQVEAFGGYVCPDCDQDT